MKIIDLLNKISNREKTPKKIKVSIFYYNWKYDDLREEYTYMRESGERLDEDILLLNLLNTEIEVIEDKIEETKKIENISDEELEECDCDYDRICLILDRLDEVIDYINKGEKQ